MLFKHFMCTVYLEKIKKNSKRVLLAVFTSNLYLFMSLFTKYNTCSMQFYHLNNVLEYLYPAQNTHTNVDVYKYHRKKRYCYGVRQTSSVGKL